MEKVPVKGVFSLLYPYNYIFRTFSVYIYIYIKRSHLDAQIGVARIWKMKLAESSIVYAMPLQCLLSNYSSLRICIRVEPINFGAIFG